MRRASLFLLLLCVLSALPTFGQQRDAEVKGRDSACPIFYDGPEGGEGGGDGGIGDGCVTPRRFESFENLEASRGPFVFLREELAEIMSEASEPEEEFAKMIKTPALQAELKAFLPESFEHQVYRRCAVVGSSGDLVRLERFGEEIDEHDFVMRFNRAPTKGYEAFVGTKTSMRLFSGEESIGFDERKDKEEGTSMANDNSEGGVMAHLIKSKKELYNLLAYSKAFEEEDDELFMISPSFMRMASQYFNQQGGEILNMLPSLGIMGLYYSMHICQSIDVYGLLGASEASGVRFRYFDSSFDKPTRLAEQTQRDFLIKLNASSSIEVSVKGRCGRECTEEGLVGCSRCFGMEVPEMIQFRQFTEEQSEANEKRMSAWKVLDEPWNSIKQSSVHAIGRNAHTNNRRHHGRGSDLSDDPTSSKGKRSNSHSHKKKKRKGLGWEYKIETGRIEECDEEDLKHYLETYQLDMPDTWLEMRMAVLEHFENVHTHHG